MKNTYDQLIALLMEVNDLQKAEAVLSWDQATQMPPGGAEARGRHMATLSRLAHQKFTDPQIGRLLDELQAWGESQPEDSDERRMLAVARREYEHAVKVPSEFVGKLSEHIAITYSAWAEARPANDFERVRPLLEKTLDYSRQYADYFPGYDHIIDPFIDEADRGMKAATISALFGELRTALAPIVQAITSQPPADDRCLRGHFPHEAQMQICREMVAKMGFDFQRGRLDLTHHPFETNFAVGDVRINTRVKEDFLGECLYSTIHEAGHGMYEQGVRPELDGTPLGGGVSAGVHESQSRLWENVVGRSWEFCQFAYPRLQELFPQLQSVPMETFYRAINRVERSLIRTDADEVTYNLHVMLRFDFEMAMLEGKLAIKDLPDAWMARFKEDFGIEPPNHSDGVLQDVHWYGGVIGGSFQGYTLGNVLSGLFYEAALKANPEIPTQIAQGQFDTLHGWLKENIYQHGSKFSPDELIQRVTGGPVRIEPYIRYLKQKYGGMYSL